MPKNAETHAKPVSSPCTGVCSLVDGYCIGCGRSAAEIGEWPAYSEAQRRRIMTGLPARLERLGDGADGRRRRRR